MSNQLLDAVTEAEKKAEAIRLNAEQEARQKIEQHTTECAERARTATTEVSEDIKERLEQIKTRADDLILTTKREAEALESADAKDEKSDARMEKAVRFVIAEIEKACQ